MNRIDITSIPPRSAPFHIDESFAARYKLIHAAREQTLRDLSRPYIEAGYAPCELTAVERQSDWFSPGRCFVLVKIAHPRSRFRLWLRRTMRRVGIFRYPMPESTPWRA